MLNYWTLAAIQKKISKARTPKMISGNDTAKPICSHCTNDLPPSPAVPEATSGKSISLDSPLASNRLRCWLNSVRASSTVLRARLNSFGSSDGFQLFGSID